MRHRGRRLAIIKHIFATAAVTLTTGNPTYADRSHQHSGGECYFHGHKMYLVDGFDYPRERWASWGISCRAPKSEGIEGTETGGAGRPAEWCGWWMRQHLGGHYGPEFNTARNWLNVGRPLNGPRSGALGIKEHHVFQVIRVVGPGEVLAISGNDHNAVRTRIRSTSGVIGWRDVAEERIATDSPTLKQHNEGVIRNSTAGTGQARSAPAPDGDY